MTLVEVFIVVAILVLLAALFLPSLAAARRKSSKIGCVSCVEQIGLAFRIWEGDNGDKYPMRVSATNGGAMELAATGNVAAVFQVMSNALSTPRILVCPMDTNQICATNFENDFNNSHISYFINIDLTNETNPQMLLCGDDNFQIAGVPIKSGLMEISTNSPIAWTDTRHHYAGNIGFADGSVQQLGQDGLRQAIQQTGFITNRLAIP